MSGARVGRRGATAVLVAVSLAQITTVLDYYALSVALPQMAGDFHVRPTDLHWMLTGYLLGFAALLVLGGRLADRYGRKRVLLIGVATFGLGSALCGLAPTIPLLVAFRVIQGVGAALIVPASMAALVQAFPRERRGWAVGIVVGVTSAGTAVGPFVGGALAGTLGWRSVFLINVPIMVAAIVMCVLALDESSDADDRGSLDWAGAALLAGMLLTLTLAIDRAREWPVVPLAITAGAAAAFLVAFLAVERRVAHPIIDLAVVRGNGVRRIIASGCMDNYGWAVCVFAVTLYLQVVRGLSPVATGAVFLALSAGTAVGGPMAGRMARWISVGPTMAVGVALSAVGLVWLAMLGEHMGFPRGARDHRRGGRPGLQHGDLRHRVVGARGAVGGGRGHHDDGDDHGRRDRDHHLRDAHRGDLAHRARHPGIDRGGAAGRRGGDGRGSAAARRGERVPRHRPPGASASEPGRSLSREAVTSATRRGRE